MSDEEVAIVESIAGPVMDRLGYRRLFVQPGQERHFSDNELKMFHNVNEKRKQKTAKSVDPEDIRRRQNQLRFLEAIKLGFDQKPIAAVS